MEIGFKVLLIIFQYILTFISIGYSIKFFKKVYTPVSVYTGINTLTISMYMLYLLPYDQITNLALSIVILSECVLLFGSIIGKGLIGTRRMNIIKKNEDISQDGLDKKNDIDTRVVKLSLRIIGVISTIGWISSFSNNMLSRYSVSFLIQNPEYIGMVGITTQYTGYLNLMGIWILPMFVYCLVKSNISKIDVFFVISALIGLFLVGTKTYIILTVVTAIFVYTSLAPKIKSRYLIIVGVFGISFFVFYNFFVDVFVGSTSINGSKFPSMLQFLEEPYRYFTASIGAFSTLTNTSGEIFPYFGYVVLSWAFKMFSFLGLYDGPLFSPLSGVSVGEFGLSTNVYTMVGEAYLDVGIIGIIILYLVIGIVFTVIFELGKDGKSLINLFLSSLLMYCLFISFFLYYLNFNVLVLIVGCFFVVIVSKRIVRWSK